MLSGWPTNAIAAESFTHGGRPSECCPSSTSVSHTTRVRNRCAHNIEPDDYAWLDEDAVAAKICLVAMGRWNAFRLKLCVRSSLSKLLLTTTLYIADDVYLTGESRGRTRTGIHAS